MLLTDGIAVRPYAHVLHAIDREVSTGIPIASC